MKQTLVNEAKSMVELETLNGQIDREFWEEIKKCQRGEEQLFEKKSPLLLIGFSYSSKLKNVDLIQGVEVEEEVDKSVWNTL